MANVFLRHLCVIVLCAGASAGLPTAAQDSAPGVRIDLSGPDREADDAAENEDDASRLARLFDNLAAAQEAEDAAFIAEEIEAIWMSSGDPSVDVLVSRAVTASAFGEEDTARRLVEGALSLDPTHAHSWSMSAMMAYEAGDIGRALSDINKALEHNPNHYEALFGLGLILEGMEQPVGAFEAYERTLALYPLHPRAQTRADSLRETARGRDL